VTVGKGGKRRGEPGNQEGLTRRGDERLRFHWEKNRIARERNILKLDKEKKQRKATHSVIKRL